MEEIRNKLGVGEYSLTSILRRGPRDPQAWIAFDQTALDAPGKQLAYSCQRLIGSAWSVRRHGGIKHGDDIASR